MQTAPPDVSKPPCLILLSGGIDSAACAYWFIARQHAVTAVFIDYGQMAGAAERRAAEAVADHLKIKLLTLKLTGFKHANVGELFGRNALLLTAAIFGAEFREGLISLGLHAGTTYFDCSPAFASSFDRLVAEMSDGHVRLVAPFAFWRKAEVFEYFRQSTLPVDITHSCERSADLACGICPSCKDRKALGIQ